MRRATYAALVLGLCLLGSTQLKARAAHQTTDHRQIASWRRHECRFARADGRGGFVRWEVKTTIRCAVRKWPVPGGVEGAFCIATKESGIAAKRDVNASSGAAGTFQISPDTFRIFAIHHEALFERWRLRVSVNNDRTNVVTGVKIAHEAGWSSWTTHRLCGL